MPASACGPRSQCRDHEERQGARAARSSGDRRRRPLGRAVPGVLRLHRRGREPGGRRPVPLPVRAPVPRLVRAHRRGAAATAPAPPVVLGRARQRPGPRRHRHPGPLPRPPRRLGHRPGDRVPEHRADPRPGHRRSRARQRGPPGLQHDGRGPVLAVPRPDGAGRGVEPGRADRGDRADGARARSRPEGARHRGHDRAPDRGRRRMATGPGPATRVHRRARCRQPLRLRPRLAALRRPRHPGHQPQRFDGLAGPQPVVQLRGEPPGTLRPEPPHVRRAASSSVA